MPNLYPDLIKQNISFKSFSSRPVETEKLRCVLEAAHCAPSYLNEQPWSFIVTAKNYKDDYDRLLNCVGSARRWASRAPVLILSVARLNFAGDGTTNIHAFRDLGRAVSNILRKAATSGLASHNIAGFDAVKARIEFQIPSGHSPAGLIALGYPGSPQSTPCSNQETRSRQPLENFVFTSQWGQASPILSS